MYVVVCRDLSISQQAVQACHASIAAGRDLVRVDSPYLVLVTVESLAGLVALSAQLTVEGIKHRVFIEDDPGGRATALATEPVSWSQRRWFRQLPLFRPELIEQVA